MNSDIASSFRPAIVMTLLMAVLLGLVYPAAITGIGQLVFPHAANGSLVEANGKVIGSSVLGQGFTTARYFDTRPSAAGKGYDPLASGGSNFGPAAKGLADRVKGDVSKARADGVAGAIPADLVTASGSGLDPDLSPAAALAQVPRIARVRGLLVIQVRSLVDNAIEHPLLGFIGEDHVNVLALNQALDRLPGQAAH